MSMMDLAEKSPTGGDKFRNGCGLAVDFQDAVGIAVKPGSRFWGAGHGRKGIFSKMVGSF